MAFISQYLKTAYNLSERQSGLITSDVSGFWQPEYFVQVGFIQAIETCRKDKKNITKQAQTGRNHRKEIPKIQDVSLMYTYVIISIFSYILSSRVFF